MLGDFVDDAVASPKSGLPAAASDLGLGGYVQETHGIMRRRSDGARQSSGDRIPPPLQHTLTVRADVERGERCAVALTG